jgi:hypothetical protein
LRERQIDHQRRRGAPWKNGRDRIRSKYRPLAAPGRNRCGRRAERERDTSALSSRLDQRTERSAVMTVRHASKTDAVGCRTQNGFAHGKLARHEPETERGIDYARSAAVPYHAWNRVAFGTARCKMRTIRGNACNAVRCETLRVRCNQILRCHARGFFRSTACAQSGGCERCQLSQGNSGH